VNPIVTLTGTTNSQGTLYQALQFGHRPEFIGSTLFSQSAAFDAGLAPIPFALSQGMKITYPVDPTTPKFVSSSKLVYWISKAWPTDNTFLGNNGLVFGLHD
jgi:hypothetical protein